MAAELEKYNQKRDFDKTGEPVGKIAASGKQLRFVIQHHIASRDHYDFRLEWNGVLLSWAVPKGPSYDPHTKRLAVKVEDHPLEYLDFEGIIPKGEYGGGVDMLWDEGTWEPLENAELGLTEGSLKLILYGKRLKGKWALIRMKPKAGETDKNWLLFKEKDEYALNEDGVSGFTTSIRTGRTMEEIEQGINPSGEGNPFDKIEVQLAKLVDKVPAGTDWLYELKYDGYRTLAYLQDNGVRLVSRNGLDYTKQFQAIAASLIEWAGGRSMVVDGEVVVVDAQGKTDFQALQKYMKNPEGENLTYVVFDLLALDGTDLRNQRLTDRKEKLAALMEHAPDNLHYSSHTAGNGKEIFAAACQANMEGIIGKKANSVYSGSRNGDWIKIKCDNRQEFVIGGYTVSDKNKNGVSSLLLGVYNGKELVYTGRAGTGFTEQSAKELGEKFAKIQTETSPFQQAPKSGMNEKLFWLKPVLVAQVKFAQWTEDNLLRQASFKGLRADKNPFEITRETPGTDNELPADQQTGPNTASAQPIRKRKMKANDQTIVVDGVTISKPDKVMFEGTGITKGDVVRYYEKVSERMLPYVGNRILSIVRCPDGASNACFYQKHPGPDVDGIITIPILENDGETEEYFYIRDVRGLLAEVQMGTLEFHPWGSRVENLEKPDMMVFDLDPDEGLDLQKVREGVRDLKSLLDELSLVSYLKTSGGKGYHVVIPLEPSAGWDAFREFAKRIAEAMEQRWPECYTSNVRKVRRKGKIFVDWIRNGRGATSVAPYSLRARKGAPVSMPILWEELDSVIPNGVKMEDALVRMAYEDPWKDFFQTHQRLKTEL